MGKDLSTLRRVMAFFWPRSGSERKWRIVVVLTAMLLSKLIFSCVPIIYKLVIDQFTRLSDTDQAITGIVLLLIVTYALGRLASVALIQFRDVIFVGVLHKTRREMATDTFRRILHLNYGFFLEDKV